MRYRARSTPGGSCVLCSTSTTRGVSLTPTKSWSWLAATSHAKRAHGLFDFDDLLLGLRALLADPTIGPHIRGLWDYVLVDEYQDVNQLQVDIVEGLRPGGDGLTVVGDDAQSIYGFRGCDPAHLHNLAVRFPSATVVKLERNYRSRPPILELANAARPEGADGPLVLDAARDGGRRPTLVSCHDAAEEARAVVDSVLAAASKGFSCASRRC